MKVAACKYPVGEPRDFDAFAPDAPCGSDPLRPVSTRAI